MAADENEAFTVTIIGAGVMGTALAVFLANKEEKRPAVRLCGTSWDAETIQVLRQTREDGRLQVTVPESVALYAYDERAEALSGSNIVIVAVASAGLRDVVLQIGETLSDDVILASITKGIDDDKGQTMAEMMEDALQAVGRRGIPVVKIGGPLRAIELAQGHPATAVFASRSIEAARRVGACFASPSLRSEVTADVVGVDLCASLKNAYAIIYGMADGLYGDVDNPKAAIIGGIGAELRAYVSAYGGNSATVAGAAGVGDLFVTIQGGRNRTFGYYLGSGHSVDEAVAKMKGQTVEGTAAVFAAMKLARILEEKGALRIKRDLPLLFLLEQVLTRNQTAEAALSHYWDEHHTCERMDAK